ncbi:hypothetical protein GpartN1_g4438.t1 [Galdieria partita]|uniref:Uncharacterized protein n=1 Tax=Galdieria partita TaxID=83374 RepID=A0A9C7PZB3_9RHOD|nr:hypothetical protein GpartN1_g4438.t1 [Galdieria partita]
MQVEQLLSPSGGYSPTSEHPHQMTMDLEEKTLQNLADSSPSETEQATGEESNTLTQSSRQQQLSKRKSKSSSERGVRDDRSQPGRLVCRWSLVSKPENSVLTNADLLYSRTPETHFKADVPGKYVLLLTVKGHGTTYTETVTFIVKDAACVEDDVFQEEETDSNSIVLKLHFSESGTPEQAPCVFDQAHESVPAAYPDL